MLQEQAQCSELGGGGFLPRRLPRVGDTACLDLRFFNFAERVDFQLFRTVGCSERHSSVGFAFPFGYSLENEITSGQGI